MGIKHIFMQHVDVFFFRHSDNIRVVSGSSSCRPLRVHNTLLSVEAHLQEDPSVGDQTSVPGKVAGFHCLL